MSTPDPEARVRCIVQDELAKSAAIRFAAETALGRQREDALMWSMRFHEGRDNSTPEGVINGAKAFEAYVYGGAR